ncbi:hypothetical protein QCA50_009882 [Cerrena zonata]|uniref:Uncharacterized protein n=1 Tax=Cerrena zonata TaxID=2478898 RepID=A0AAW0G5W2_9APHY
MNQLYQEQNAGLDSLETLGNCQDEISEGHTVGVDLKSGEPMDPSIEGVWDSFRVIRNAISSATGIASNLLLCDELLKAGRSSLKEGAGGPPGGAPMGAPMGAPPM